MLIQVTQVLAVSTPDVLSGTQLDQTPLSGVYKIFAASTQNDTTIQVSLGGNIIVQAQALNLRTSGVPSLSDDPMLMILGPAGARPVIGIVEVTAASIYVIVQFFTLDEL